MLTETLKLQATEHLFFFPKKPDCTRLSPSGSHSQTRLMHDMMEGKKPDIFQVKSSKSPMCSRGGWRPWRPTQPTAHTTAPRSRAARRRRRKRTWFPLHTWKLHYRWLQSWKPARIWFRFLLTCCLSCPTPDGRRQPEEAGRGGYSFPVHPEKWRTGRK